MSEYSKSSLVLNAGESSDARRVEELRALLVEVHERPAVAEVSAIADKLQAEHRRLIMRGREVNAAMAGAVDTLTKERLAFEARVSGAGPIPSDARAMVQARTLFEELNRAVHKLQFDATPRAEARALLGRSEFLEVFARELSQAAEERLVETLAALAPALDREGILSFDPSKTASGALQQQARQFLEEAASLRTQAEELLAKHKITLQEGL